MDLAVAAYQFTAGYPRTELYGLVSQTRRAAVSIPCNIAEGQGRGTGNEFAYHLRVGQGSLQEIETQVLIGERLAYVAPDDLSPLMDLADEVGRLMRGLSRSIEGIH